MCEEGKFYTSHNVKCFSRLQSNYEGTYTFLKFFDKLKF